MPSTFPFRHLVAAASAVLAAAASTGCTSLRADRLLDIVTPYKVDVMQGNVITKEMVATVKPGMSRDQVRDALGSPLLASAFHADRWDYVFTMRRQGIEPQKRSVVAYFKGDVLERLEAPELPSEHDFVSSIRPARAGSGPEPVLALTDEQRKALPRPVKSESAAAAQPQGATRPYPALEAQ
jgi:outer membrane protein assembly factor BamE